MIPHPGSVRGEGRGEGAVDRLNQQIAGPMPWDIDGEWPRRTLNFRRG